jgi:hypothetical protein
LQYYYSNETWAVKPKDKYRITAAEMTFMWKTTKCTWRDHKTNEEILNKVISILNKIPSYKRDWIQHITRMTSSRLPNLLKKYASRGIRNQDRQLKRILDD